MKPVYAGRAEHRRRAALDWHEQLAKVIGVRPRRTAQRRAWRTGYDRQRPPVSNVVELRDALRKRLP
jgi:hypothetical protein